jgi:hypothetical protein
LQGIIALNNLWKPTKCKAFDHCSSTSAAVETINQQHHKSRYNVILAPQSICRKSLQWMGLPARSSRSWDGGTFNRASLGLKAEHTTFATDSRTDRLAEDHV